MRCCAVQLLLFPRHQTLKHTRAPRNQPTQQQKTTEWLAQGLLQRLVLVITSAVSREVLERWTFEVETDAEVLGGG